MLESLTSGFRHNDIYIYFLLIRQKILMEGMKCFIMKRYEVIFFPKKNDDMRVLVML